MNATFRKHERLCSRTLIQEVFAKGKSFSVYPFRAVWLEAELPNEVPVQVTFAVPKKKIRKAVDRNRVKRLMREGYRKHKSIHYPVLESNQKQLALILIYLPREPLPFPKIEQKIILTLQRLVKECQG